MYLKVNEIKNILIPVDKCPKCGSYRKTKCTDDSGVFCNYCNKYYLDFEYISQETYDKMEEKKRYCFIL